MHADNTVFIAVNCYAGIWDYTINNLYSDSNDCGKERKTLIMDNNREKQNMEETNFFSSGYTVKTWLIIYVGSVIVRFCLSWVPISRIQCLWKRTKDDCVLNCSLILFCISLIMCQKILIIYSSKKSAYFEPNY